MGRFDRFMVHVDLGTEEKLAELTDSERLCHIVGVLAIAAKSPVRGRLIVGESEATAAHVAKRADVSRKVAESTLRKLKAVGILVRDDEAEAWAVHAWEQYNPAPKTDRTGADRQARYRARNASRNAVTNAGAPSRDGGEVEGEEEGGVQPPLPPTPGYPDIVDRVVGVLQRGVDGVVSDEPCRPVSSREVAAALAGRVVDDRTAMAVAIDVRSIAQSQNRAPNITALYVAKLAKTTNGAPA